MEKIHSEQVRLRFLQAAKYIISSGQADNDKSLCEKLGVFPQNLPKIKNGDRYPTIEVLVNMCLYFNINPAWLLLGTGQMQGQTPDSDLSKRINDLERIVSGMLKKKPA